MVSHRHVVEVLDSLAQGPVTLMKMRAQIRANWGGLESALRALAAGGLVTRCDGGTWDSALRRDRLYRLTDRGCQVVQELSRWSVWTAILDTQSDALDNGLD
jgi:DNA-binding HxlR family transcriptional regulator